MEHITIHLFRKFIISYRGQDVSKSLFKSPKSIALLKYLILHQGSAISTINLIDTFWNDESHLNPENSLRTLISRIRKALSQEAPELKDCIVTEQGNYRWNPSIICDVDVFSFEKLYQELLSIPYYNSKSKEKFQKILQIYKGNLDDSLFFDDWLRGQSLYYQDLYMKLVLRFIKFYKEEQNYNEIIITCRNSLNVDPFNEALHLELMNALKSSGQNNAALVHFHQATNIYQKYLGIEPPAEMLELHKQLTKVNSGIIDDFTAIKNNLLRVKSDNKAIVCDYYIFKDIYQIQARNAERLGIHIFLVVAAIEHINSDEEFNTLVLDKVMQDLLHVLISQLRKGDTISRYSPSQFAILLQMNSEMNGEIVTERLRIRFQEKNTNPYANLVFLMNSIIEM